MGKEKSATAKGWTYLAAVTGNLVPFVPVFAVFAGKIGNATAALAVGGVMTVVGIVLNFLFRSACEERTLPWLFSMLCFGVAKGGCAAALFLKLEMAAVGLAADIRVSLSAAGIALATGAVCALLCGLSRRRKPFGILAALLPVPCVIAVIVLLACRHELFFGLLLVNLLTVLFCSALFWGEYDDGAERRLVLSVASMFYAVALFLVALCVLSDGDCCDNADCDCPADCGGGKKKKR